MKTSRANWLLLSLLTASAVGFTSTGSQGAELPALTLSGPSISVGGKLFAAPSVGFRVGEAVPPSLEVNGKEVAAATLGSPWTSGEYTVAVAGTSPLSFQVDADPPLLRWEATDRGIFESRGEPRVRSFHQDRERERQRDDGKERRHTTGILYSSDGRGWRPLAGHGDQLPEVKIESDHPQLFLRGDASLVTEDGKRLDLSAGKLLWIEATDAGCGVASLTVRVRPASGGGGGTALEVEAVDLLGNARRLSWSPGAASR